MNSPNIEQRLERIEGHVQNLDTRLERVEQILPTLASKDDLKAFATKDDLAAFPTKEDAKAFATKDDLKAFATKDDIKVFVTREDAKAFATKDDLKPLITKDHLAAFGEREAASMRAFVLEIVQKANADLRNEMRVLFEEQRTWFHALTEHLHLTRHETTRVEMESKSRDAALDRRLTRLERD